MSVLGWGCGDAGSVPKSVVSDARALGLKPEDGFSRAQLESAARASYLSAHPDKGGNNEAFNAARSAKERVVDVCESSRSENTDLLHLSGVFADFVNDLASAMEGNIGAASRLADYQVPTLAKEVKDSARLASAREGGPQDDVLAVKMGTLTSWASNKRDKLYASLWWSKASDYGEDGYSSTTGLNRAGFDREGYNGYGFHWRTGLDRSGRDVWGFDRAGVDASGNSKSQVQAARNQVGYTFPVYTLRAVRNKRPADPDARGLPSERDAEAQARELQTYGTPIPSENYVLGVSLLGFDANGYNEHGRDPRGYDARGFDFSGENAMRITSSGTLKVEWLEHTPHTRRSGKTTKTVYTWDPKRGHVQMPFWTPPGNYATVTNSVPFQMAKEARVMRKWNRRGVTAEKDVAALEAAEVCQKFKENTIVGHLPGGLATKAVISAVLSVIKGAEHMANVLLLGRSGASERRALRADAIRIAERRVHDAEDEERESESGSDSETPADWQIRSRQTNTLLVNRRSAAGRNAHSALSSDPAAERRRATNLALLARLPTAPSAQEKAMAAHPDAVIKLSSAARRCALLFSREDAQRALNAVDAAESFAIICIISCMMILLLTRLYDGNTEHGNHATVAVMDNVTSSELLTDDSEFIVRRAFKSICS